MATQVIPGTMFHFKNRMYLIIEVQVGWIGALDTATARVYYFTHRHVNTLRRIA